VAELLLLVTANLLCLVAMYWRRQIAFLQVFPEQMVSILIGFLLGGLASLLKYEELTADVTYGFSGVFFEFLLPAIIFSNAYSVKHKSFFRNLSGILCFTFAGTLISALFIGYGVYFASHAGWIREVHKAASLHKETQLLPHKAGPGGTMPLVDCLILGSLLSAVDPGAVLSVFSVPIDRQVYGLLFGESVLNSAVAIVLYNSFRMYHNVLVTRQDVDVDDVEAGDVKMLFYRFIAITMLSMMVGIGVGLTSALILKHTHLYRSPGKEQAVLFLFAYLSYLLPRQAGLSPVVSLFLCGATMAHYTFYNISRMSQIATVTWFKTIGHVAETFVFVFLGVSVTDVKGNEYRRDLVLALIVLCVLSRFVHIFLLSGIINAAKFLMSFVNLGFDQINYRRHNQEEDERISLQGMHGQKNGATTLDEMPPERKHPVYISWQAQFFISWSGLRGAVAFALALHAPVLNQEGEMVTTTVAVVLFTYVVLGSTAQTLASRLGLIALDGQDHVIFHEMQREKLIQSLPRLRSPSAIMRYGSSPDPTSFARPHLEKYGSMSSNLSGKDAAGSSFALVSSNGEYGTFTKAWKHFDNDYMKPIFGGSMRRVTSPTLQETGTMTTTVALNGATRQASLEDLAIDEEEQNGNQMVL